MTTADEYADLMVRVIERPDRKWKPDLRTFVYAYAAGLRYGAKLAAREADRDRD